MEFSSGDDYIKSDVCADILVMDIGMDENNGLAVKDMLEKRQINTAILFVTSRGEMMAEAFGRNVYGFFDQTGFL